MMMHPDFVALAMVMIRLGEGRGGSAERRSQESEGDGNFLHGIFHRCEAGKKVKWLHIAGLHAQVVQTPTSADELNDTPQPEHSWLTMLPITRSKRFPAGRWLSTYFPVNGPKAKWITTFRKFLC